MTTVVCSGECSPQPSAAGLGGEGAWGTEWGDALPAPLTSPLLGSFSLRSFKRLISAVYLKEEHHDSTNICIQPECFVRKAKVLNPQRRVSLVLILFKESTVGCDLHCIK